MNKTIVVDGWYGVPNAGDEAILESISQMVTDDFSSVELIATSNKVNHTIRTHSVSNAIPRFQCRRPNLTWLKTIKRADELWIGGGGLFSNPNLFHYSQMISIARALDTRIVIVGIGATNYPPDDEYSDLLTLSLNYADLIITRNNNSANSLRSSGVTTPIFPLADFVFRYNSDTSIPDKWRNIDENSIIVSVRDPPLNRSLDISSLAKSLDTVSRKEDRNIHFLPFNNDHKISDTETSNKVATAMETEVTVHENPPGFKTLYEIIDNVSVVVGMRLHSMIFSARARTPFVGIAYRPKCQTLLNDLDKNTWWCDDIDSEELSEDILKQIEQGFSTQTIERIAQKEAKANLISTVISECHNHNKPSAHYLYQEVIKACTLDAIGKIGDRI